MVGLWDQLSGETSFINDLGRFERVKTTNKGLDTSAMSIVEKISECVSNWFSHIMSDVSGSVSSKDRGRGLPAPFMSVIRFLEVGSISVKEKNKIIEKTIGQVVEKMFISGYDVRTFTAQLIPVLVYEIIVRNYWFYKQYFYYKKEFSNCIPLATQENHSLSRMLLIASGTFSLVDVGHAMIKVGLPPKPTDIMKFLLTINYPGLLNLGFRVFQNMRNTYKRNKKIEKRLEEDLRKEIQGM